jgi:trehalose 6-phosphate phosphatase
MRHHALSKEGRSALRTLATQSILYGFDFDGTLARISADRERVMLSRSMQEWLMELSKRAPCAIISGRSLPDLLPRIGTAVPHMVGNHGLESPLTDPSVLNRAEAICLGWMQAVNAELSQLLTDQGVQVENKRYTLTFHYRGAKDPAHVHLALPLLLNRLTPLPRLTFGHACINALPPGHQGKGAAALALMRRLRQAGLFYIGDDGADEEVFESPDGLALGIRVGKQADSRAQFYVDHQGQVEDVIRFLVHRLDRTPEALDPDDLAGTTRKTA